jgi:hypothetical protein
MKTDSKIALTRLYRKVSARSGEQYFVGRLGAARVLLFKDRDQPDEGDEVFSLMIEPIADQTEAPPLDIAKPSRHRKSEIMKAFDRLDARLANEAAAPPKRASSRHDRGNVVAALRRIGAQLDDGDSIDAIAGR